MKFPDNFTRDGLVLVFYNGSPIRLFWNEEQGFLSKSENCEHLKNFRNVDCVVTNHNQKKGAFFGDNPNPDFRIPKRILRFLGANRRRNHKSIKSTLWVDSSDQIQIRILEINNLSIFWGKGFIKSVFDKRFSEQKWHTTGAVHV